MKILDYYSIIKMNFRSKKMTFFKNIILISLSVIILIISFILINSINNVLDKNIKYNVSYRSIYVGNKNRIDTKKFISNIENIEHIQKVVEQEAYMTYVNICSIDNRNVNGDINIMGANEDIEPNVIKGEKIKNNEKNVCIIPKQLYIGDAEKNVDMSKMFNGEDLINKQITISYNRHDYSKGTPIIKNREEKKFKVIGIYDVKDNMGKQNEIYANFEDVYNISNNIIEGAYMEDQYSPVIAIVDSAENVENVIDKLDKLGYYTQLRSIPNVDLPIIINVISNVLIIFMIILSLFSIIINAIKNSKDRSKDIGLLKAIGYTNYDIWKIIISESIVIGILSYLLACLITILLISGINNIIQNSNLEIQSMQLIINWKLYIYGGLIAVIVPILGNVISSIKIINQPVVINSKE